MVHSFTDPRDYQYNYKMAPAILKAKWRKGSQVLETFPLLMDSPLYVLINWELIFDFKRIRQIVIFVTLTEFHDFAPVVKVWDKEMA